MGAPGWPHPVNATGSPCRTRSPFLTSFADNHEYVEERPPPWSIVRKRYPPTGPANVTVPSSGATTVVPTAAAISIPRCPLPYGVSGGSNVWVIGPTTGHVQPPADAADAADAAGTLPAAMADVRTARATMILGPRRIEAVR